MAGTLRIRKQSITEMDVDCIVNATNSQLRHGGGVCGVIFAAAGARELQADCEKRGVGSEQSHLRFDTLSAHTGPADEMGVRDLLESVAQKNYPQTEGSYEKTMWSIVYCPEGLCADFYFAENYEHSYGLLLQEKGSFLKR